ncbi:hypothetical protein Pedsa_2200 [Pseudopedobacter saltans DSM 12145]|uniref:Heme-binding protein n=1 Tax=Pseudopedobacter saltans (strain ATCC 51119 / DSM 12145 / JCM 21818 / CCUG 39354 / LMG 10337 / NBRC 100064 / NCIMB 13643) TaxID=762903 RepID=F0SBR1_PSESL|nr:hypothetical protein [Pseudopedobacter saltans]ADY52752.1 hypothetical protein Pedsa_2200 [Pseudopedobacter saltans DSM 12145]
MIIENILESTVKQIIFHIESMVPQYMEIPEDRQKANGNVAVCIIEGDGTVHGKIFGENKIKGRDIFRVAWLKASQVWITGYQTGEYEQLIFTNQLQEDENGIRKPDMIGWEGGQPIYLKDGTMLSIGFSGFRGQTDLEIVKRAVEAAQTI